MEPKPGDAAGWYPDPRTPGQVRWWNGVGWGDDTLPAAGAAPSAPHPWAPPPPGPTPGRSSGAKVVIALVAVIVALFAIPLVVAMIFALVTVFNAEPPPAPCPSISVDPGMEPGPDGDC